MTEWHYADTHGQAQGPFSAEQLRARLQRGELDHRTLVWCADLPDWQPLQHCAEALELTLPPPLPGETTATATIPANGLTGAVVDAGLWRRVAASIIDSFITTMVGYALMIPLMIVLGVGTSALRDRGAADAADGLTLLWFIAVYALLISVPAVYFGWMQSMRSQASLGKLAVGIKVVRGDGSRIGFWRGALRYLSLVLLTVLTLGIAALVSAFMAGMGQRKQALHDLICDTRVVDRWAYTDQPDRQQAGLDTVTKVVLAAYAALLLLAVTATLFSMLLMGLSAFGRWFG